MAMASKTVTVGRLEILDIGVIVVYFVVVIGFGLWVSTVYVIVYHSFALRLSSRYCLSRLHHRYTRTSLAHPHCFH